MVLMLLYPFLGHGDDPLSFEEVCRITISTLATISFLIPNSLRTGRILFYLRIVVMFAAGASMIDMSLRLESGVYGPKPPVTLFGPMEFAAFCAPILLLWRRYSMDRLPKECEIWNAPAA